MIYGTVLCLGDSLTEGARAPCGWPELLPEALDLRSVGTRWATLNRGISGQTTLEILRRTPQAVRELAGMPGTKWCVILAGTNDSKCVLGADEDSLDVWCRLHTQIFHWPRRYPDIGIVLCTFPPVSPEMPQFANSGPWLSSASRMVLMTARGTNGRKTIDGARSRVVVADLQDMPREHLVDGVHLTMDGNWWVAERIADAILPEPANDGRFHHPARMEE